MSLGHDLENWLESTLAGFAALRAGDGHAALSGWRESLDIAKAGALRRSPFHAVACNNAMVGGALDPRGGSQEAGRLGAAWAEVVATASCEDIPLPARSTAFHLRLASRHAQPYASFLRVRARALATLGRQIGEVNVLSCTGAPDEVAALLRGVDQTQAQLPGFLDAALQALLRGPLNPAEALSLLDRQLAQIRSYRSGEGLPESFWRQMETALDFCAFAPSAIALLRAGQNLELGEPGT